MLELIGALLLLVTVVVIAVSKSRAKAEQEELLRRYSKRVEIKDSFIDYKDMPLINER
jgi:hypothetical protein